jgi:hydroxypyruvate isomerase
MTAESQARLGCHRFPGGTFPMPRISANLGFLWPDRPVPERIEAAAAAGFRAIELHFPYAHPPEAVRAQCERLGLTLLGINTDVDPARGEAGLAAVPGRGAEARALIDRAFDWAERAGGSAVHVMAGKVAPEARAAGREALLASLAHAAGRAEASGLTVLVEPLNPRDMPGYFYSRTAEAAEIVAALGSPRVRLMYDCYHVGCVEGDVIMRMRALWEVIGHIQVAAVPSRAEPDEGELNYPAIFAEIDRLGWTGWVGAEYRPRAATDAGLGWIGAMGLRLA